MARSGISGRELLKSGQKRDRKHLKIGTLSGTTYASVNVFKVLLLALQYFNWFCITKTHSLSSCTEGNGQEHLKCLLLRPCLSSVKILEVGERSLHFYRNERQNPECSFCIQVIIAIWSSWWTYPLYVRVFVKRPTRLAFWGGPSVNPRVQTA